MFFNWPLIITLLLYYYNLYMNFFIDRNNHRSNEEVSVKYHHPMINRYGNDCIPIGL